MSGSACPICHGGSLEVGEGRLDQSGDSYLPTATLRCPRCGYARFEPALHARWRPSVEGVAEAPPAPRPRPAAPPLRVAAEPIAA